MVNSSYVYISEIHVSFMRPMLFSDISIFIFSLPVIFIKIMENNKMFNCVNDAEQILMPN